MQRDDKSEFHDCSNTKYAVLCHTTVNRKFCLKLVYTFLFQNRDEHVWFHCPFKGWLTVDQSGDNMINWPNTAIIKWVSRVASTLRRDWDDFVSENNLNWTHRFVLFCGFFIPSAIYLLLLADFMRNIVPSQVWYTRHHDIWDYKSRTIRPTVVAVSELSWQTLQFVLINNHSVCVYIRHVKSLWWSTYR